MVEELQRETDELITICFLENVNNLDLNNTPPQPKKKSKKSKSKKVKVKKIEKPKGNKDIQPLFRRLQQHQNSSFIDIL